MLLFSLLLVYAFPVCYYKAQQLLHICFKHPVYLEPMLFLVSSEPLESVLPESPVGTTSASDICVVY
jgi:hypothetical protein